MDLKIQNKKAMVFGSSAGIGKAIASSLSQEGASVTLNGRNEDRLKQTAKQININQYLMADLSKPNQARDTIKEHQIKFGDVDILIINTGGPNKGYFQEITISQWHQDFQTLWMSSVEAIQEVLPSMIKNKYGRIIFVTSLAARTPLKALTTSNGLRAGLTGLVKSLATGVAKEGITINALLPGYTDTERIQSLQLTNEAIKNMVPAGRLGNPEELAALATFLCSPIAGYINGESIAVAGGL